MQKGAKTDGFGSFFGTLDWIRTSGLPLRRRTLYPAELPGQVRFFVLRRRYRIIVPQFAASVNAGGGFCPEFRLIFWQKKLHRSFFYGIISGRAYERRSHPVPASPRIFDRTAALPHGLTGRCRIVLVSFRRNERTCRINISETSPASPQSPLKFGTPKRGHPSPAPLRLLLQTEPACAGLRFGTRLRRVFSIKQLPRAVSRRGAAG